MSMVCDESPALAKQRRRYILYRETRLRNEGAIRVLSSFLFLGGVGGLGQWGQKLIKKPWERK